MCSNEPKGLRRVFYLIQSVNKLSIPSLDNFYKWVKHLHSFTMLTSAKCSAASITHPTTRSIHIPLKPLTATSRPQSLNHHRVQLTQKRNFQEKSEDYVALSVGSCQEKNPLRTNFHGGNLTDIIKKSKQSAKRFAIH